MAKKTKAMRVARPTRASVTAGVDFLRVRLDQLCDQAEASLVALRTLDLGAEQVKFGEASQGLEDAYFYIQGIEEALEARLKAREAAAALRHLAIDDCGDKDDLAPGLTAKMLAEVRRGIREALLIRRTA
jgi:hypothetical protein